MVILKKGTIFKDFKYFKCKNCGCIFKAEKGEWHTTSQFAQQLDGAGAYECECPSCGDMVDGNGAKVVLENLED